MQFENRFGIALYYPHDFNKSESFQSPQFPYELYDLKKCDEKNSYVFQINIQKTVKNLSEKELKKYCYHIQLAQGIN